MKLSEALDEYLAHVRVERGLSPHTLAAYRRDLGRYVIFLNARGIDDISRVDAGDVSAFSIALRDGGDGGTPLAASSAGRAVVAVRGWHRFCALEGWTAIDPAHDVKPAKTTRRLPKAITPEQVVALIDAAGAGTDGEAGEGEMVSPAVRLRDAALLEVLYATGARISEAVALDVDDIDLDASRAAVRLFGKGRKERIVPVGGPAVRAVDAYVRAGRPESLAKARQGTPALFLGIRGARLSRQAAWAILQSAARKAGLEAHVSPHTMRHSFATHLLAGGADIRVVQELLGHASVTTTQIYTLVTPDALREVYATSHPRAL